MSNVQSQIDRIRNNIDAAYIALEALGVDVPEGATVDELAALINDAAAAHWESSATDILERAKESGEFDGADGKSIHASRFSGIVNPEGYLEIEIDEPVELGDLIVTADGNVTKVVDNSVAELPVCEKLFSVAGKDGDPGKDGVGIATIKQTTTSSADGGSNVFTVALTNGTSSTFTVKNGSKGSNGADGKTPVKGTDYYTAADKAEMVDMVLAALPAWKGGNY